MNLTNAIDFNNFCLRHVQDAIIIHSLIVLILHMTPSDYRFSGTGSKTKPVGGFVGSGPGTDRNVK